MPAAAVTRVTGGVHPLANASSRLLIPQHLLGLPTKLGERAGEQTARLRVMASRPLTGRSTALVAAIAAAIAVISNELRPQPWHLQVLAPLGAGAVGWLLASRYGQRPSVVVWGLLGLFTGASAAQRLEDYGLVLPLAIVGCVVGVLVTTVQGTAGE